MQQKQESTLDQIVAKMDGTAFMLGIIYLQLPNGEDTCWYIHASVNDTPKSMKEHFESLSFLWPKGAQFIGAEMWNYGCGVSVSGEGERKTA